MGVDAVFLDLNLHHFSALDGSCRCRRIVRVESKRAVCAAQIGRAHAGKRLPFAQSREICRNPVNIIRHVLFVQNLPERLAVPQLFRRAAAQRITNCQGENCASAFDFRGRKIQLESFRVAVNKIENPWPPAFIPVIRFDHPRALRRDAGRQTPKRSLRGQPREVRILPSAMNFVSRSGSRPSSRG